MRFLIVSDLHGRLHWWEWLLSQANSFDAILLAGDLITAFSEESEIYAQRALAEVSCEAIRQSGIPVLVCEGNHDASLPWPWMKRNLGAHRLGGHLICTLPFFPHPRVEQDLRLYRSRAESENLELILLDHCPPVQSLTSGRNTIICQPRPAINMGASIIVSGHVHMAPFVDGAWKDLVKGTICFNAGALAHARVPCFILWDTETRVARWTAEETTRVHTFTGKELPVAV